MSEVPHSISIIQSILAFCQNTVNCVHFPNNDPVNLGGKQHDKLGLFFKI